MKNLCSRPVATASMPSMIVQAIWDVNEGPAYDVHRTLPGSDGLIAIRTWRGAGRVYLKSEKTLDLGAGTLVVIPQRDLVRYHCVGPRWKFWWIEFTVVGARFFPVGTILEVSRRAGEAQEFRTVFVVLRRQAAAQRALAAALFSALLCRWTENAGNAPHTRHDEAITRVIDSMMDWIEHGWRIREMADTAGMSERTFRNAFRVATGLSPKAFYDRTRLAFAEELLKLGTNNVSEIAARLGYSSPFHFSKAFKQKYGVPPVRLLVRLLPKNNGQRP